MLSATIRSSSRRQLVLLQKSLAPSILPRPSLIQCHSKKPTLCTSLCWHEKSIRTFTTTKNPTNNTKDDSEKNKTWEPSHLEIMGGITAFFIIKSVTPEIIQKMKESDSTYEETDFEDAMRREMLDVSHEIQRGGDILSSLERLMSDDAGSLGDAGDGPNNNNDKSSSSSSSSSSNTLMDNNKAVKNTVDVVSDVLQSDALQRAITSLITRVVESHQFQAALQKLIRNLWNDLVNDPETLAQIVTLLNNAIQNEQIKHSVKQLLLQLLKDDEIYDELTALLIRLGEENEVRLATQALLTESAHQALNDPEILDHSMEFATDVVGDDVVQRTSGEALRNTVSYAVRPSLSSFLGALGFGLLLFSYSALRNARSSGDNDMDAIEIGPVVSNIMTKNILTPLSYIVKAPGRLISKLGTLLVKAITYPWTIVVNRCAAWIPKILPKGENNINFVVNSACTAMNNMIRYPYIYVTQKGRMIIYPALQIIVDTFKKVIYCVSSPSFFYQTILSWFRKGRKKGGDSIGSNTNNDDSLIL